MSRKINYVSKAVDGTYSLTIKGNTMSVSDTQGNYGSRTFSDEEKFDVGKGFWNCFKQIKDSKRGIKIGDKVKIIDANWIYENYWQWFDDIEMVKGFIPNSTPYPDEIYTVAKVGPHKENPENTVIAITNDCGIYWLVDANGVKKV